MLDPTKFQVITKEDDGEAEFLLSRGAIDAAILDLELTDASAIRLIEEMQASAPALPASSSMPVPSIRDWEEDAYLLGVAHVLDKARPRQAAEHDARPRAVHPDAKGANGRGRARLASAQAGAGGFGSFPRTRSAPAFFRRAHAQPDCEALLKQFLLLLREIIGVNRAIIFLRKPSRRPQ